MALIRNTKIVRDASLSVRTKPHVKAVAEQMAAADDRTVAGWLERLILKEAAARGLPTEPGSKKPAGK